MHIKRRLAVILALATAGALTVAGIALAAANSTVVVTFTPSNLPTTNFQNGKLGVHTHTTYTNPGNANPSGATDRAQLYFDDDFKVNTSAAPKCNSASISGQINMQQAMAQCGSSLVGKGTAKAVTPNPGSFGVNGCVLIFNGQGSTSEVLLFTRVQVSNPSSISCANPASNTGGNTTVLLTGDLKANPTSLPGDFTGGRQLDVNHITNQAALPLTDFNVTAQKGSYVSARCHDANKQLNLRVKFGYETGPQVQTVNDTFACT